MKTIVYDPFDDMQTVIPDIFKPEVNYAMVQAAEAEYIQELKQRCEIPDGDDYLGYVIQFPVADGYAQYLVVSLEPEVILIHLPFGDGYSFEYEHLLTIKEVKQKVDSAKAIAKLFADKKQGN